MLGLIHFIVCFFSWIIIFFDSAAFFMRRLPPSPMDFVGNKSIEWQAADKCWFRSGRWKPEMNTIYENDCVRFFLLSVASSACLRSTCHYRRAARIALVRSRYQPNDWHHFCPDDLAIRGHLSRSRDSAKTIYSFWLFYRTSFVPSNASREYLRLSLAIRFTALVSMTKAQNKSDENVESEKKRGETI